MKATTARPTIAPMIRVRMRRTLSSCRLVLVNGSPFVDYPQWAGYKIKASGAWMLQITRSPQVFDVVVVGSGAGGGTAVKVLTDRGLNVALLEAGPMLNPQKDFKEHVMPIDVDHRGAGQHAEMYFGRQQWGYFNA